MAVSEGRISSVRPIVHTAETIASMAYTMISSARLRARLRPDHASGTLPRAQSSAKVEKISPGECASILLKGQ